MSSSKSNLNLVSGSQAPKPMDADEFAASFMQLATSLVDFERNSQSAPQEKKFRVASLSSLRMSKPVEKDQGQDPDLGQTEAEAATVMAFRPRSES
jgi:hypothetical protein